MKASTPATNPIKRSFFIVFLLVIKQEIEEKVFRFIRVQKSLDVL
jgi:hypothetical protein